MRVRFGDVGQMFICLEWMRGCFDLHWFGFVWGPFGCSCLWRSVLKFELGVSFLFVEIGLVTP